MIELSHSQRLKLFEWLPPESPGYLVGPHVLHTGCGRAWADCFPRPHALLAESAGNYQFYGDVEAFSPSDLAPLIKGFVDCPPEFDPLMSTAFPDLKTWPRVVYALDSLQPIAAPAGAVIRRLVSGDEQALSQLSPDSAWVTKTWGGAGSAIAGGTCWGAFVEGRLVSVACTFFIGNLYEDLGTATEPAFRAKGLSAACTAALCRDVLRRGKRASWNTSRDNAASIRVAEKVGFRFVRSDRLLLVGIDSP